MNDKTWEVLMKMAEEAIRAGAVTAEEAADVMETINQLEEKTKEPALTWDLPKYYVADGTRKGAIEIYFEGMPGTGWIQTLKADKFRWNGKKKCWYGFFAKNYMEQRRAEFETYEKEIA